jgi:hypothetical protein
LSDDELAAALAALEFERFLQVMPDEWRAKFKAWAGGQKIRRAKVQHPNLRLKKSNKAKRKVVGGAEASPTPH